MKIRSGFVSNSSSSSFVILGFDTESNVPEEELKKRTVLWKNSDSGSYRLVGKLIACGDENWSEWNSDYFDKQYAEAKEFMNKIIREFSLGPRDLKLYFLNQDHWEFGLAQDMDKIEDNEDNESSMSEYGS